MLAMYSRFWFHLALGAGQNEAVYTVICMGRAEQLPVSPKCVERDLGKHQEAELLFPGLEDGAQQSSRVAAGWIVKACSSLFVDN